MRISDWSSDVYSSDLRALRRRDRHLRSGMAHVAPGNGGEVATAAHGRGRTLRAARLCRLRRCGVGLRWPSGAELLRLATAFAGELLEARPYGVADQRAGRLLQLLAHNRRRCRQALGRQGKEK